MSTPAPENDPLALGAAVVGQATSEIRRAFAQRLAVPVDAPLQVILDRLDEVLAAQADPPAAGTVLVDEITLEQLRRDAEVARAHHERQLLAEAVRVGRIPPAAVSSWRLMFEADPVSAEATLHKIKPNTIPVQAIGRGDGGEETQELYQQVFGGS